MEKSFFLVFEDLLDHNQKSVAGPFLAESHEALAVCLQLQKRTDSSSRFTPTYWDGKNAGDVVIYIVLAREHLIQTPKDLQEFALKLHCGWY